MLTLALVVGTLAVSGFMGVYLHNYGAQRARAAFLDEQYRRWDLEPKRLQLVFLREFGAEEFPTHQLVKATRGLSRMDHAFGKAVDNALKPYEDFVTDYLKYRTTRTGSQ